ncbi:MAG: carbon storage regulator [Syntrophorhabdaceae bacterium]|nr:carbon storage regulator [Syntrophorhabdaceae bacterium]
MLVLSRKRNEGILIRGKDGDIRIILIDVDRGKIRLGIDAPKGYTILREEILSEIKDANRLSLVDNLERIKGIIGDKGE